MFALMLKWNLTVRPDWCNLQTHGLSPVGPLNMPHQISILSKRFPADSADKWFLSCVCSHVQLRVFVAFKMFAANLTVIYLG